MKESRGLENCWLIHPESTSSKEGHRCASLTRSAKSRPSSTPSAPRGDRNGEEGEGGEKQGDTDGVDDADSESEGDSDARGEEEGDVRVDELDDDGKESQWCIYEALGECAENEGLVEGEAPKGESRGEEEEGGDESPGAGHDREGNCNCRQAVGAGASLVVAGENGVWGANDECER